MRPAARRQPALSPGEIAFTALGAAALVASPPMATVALGLVITRRRVAWDVSLASLAVGLVLWRVGLLDATWGAAWRQANVGRLNGVVADPGAAWSAAQPQIFYGWALLVPLAPALAWVLALVRPRDATQQARASAERRRDRERRRERRATPRAVQREPVIAKAGGEHGLAIARRISGERPLPVARGELVVLPRERLHRHVLIAGATGSGKTETALRIAYTLAQASPSAVFYLDAKGDKQTAQRFCALMAAAGRRPRLFPNESFDGWRGSAHDVHNRLLEVTGLPSEGDAVWYRYVADLALGLACAHPDGPPRSSGELLSRLDLGALRAAHGDRGELRALTADKVADVRVRYGAFFGQVGSTLDGGWAWDDVDAAYLLLPGLARADERGALARYLFADFAHYFTTRKNANRPCLLVVDEFSAIAKGDDMAARVEQARSFNAALVLVPQVVAGMGSAEQAARILGSVETTICHRTNTPEDLIDPAGTRQVIEYSQHVDHQTHTGLGTARLQHQFNIDPNHVRALNAGTAFIISRGQAMKARMLQAPATDHVAMCVAPPAPSPHKQPGPPEWRQPTLSY